ncbi:MAG: hypothetical protein Q4P78_02900 [Rothia sp. (in: high G+C Gram-positive bacteria)]|uniref:hypothetical protein n=1 Tax=Rothia sp. (in: high G+C Gram-positive bacteria) TaxID=1885016 RepID=UPI0026E06962|nr:hypothetical protein [Rothia sp. (in: high G+C Gram-positive bacteria)]MDO5750138.1 hypothetical protein [Rothia sp. (in: high G+C Gram-positive bacteria)]
MPRTDSPKDSAHSAEEGSISPLIIGCVLLIIIIGATLTAITSVHLHTQRLTDYADAQLSYAKAEDKGESKLKDPGAAYNRARSRVNAYSTQHPIGASYDSYTVQNLSLEGDTLRLQVSARVHPPIISLFIPEGIDITAQSSARLEEDQ